MVPSGAQVQDALVRHAAVAAGVRDARSEARGDVVGVEDGGLGVVRSGPRRPSSRCTSTRSAGSAALPRGRGRPAPTGGGPPAADVVAGQERHQVADHADRADAGPRRRAGCRRSCAGSGGTRRRRTAGRGQADQGVHVGAVHVDLATRLWIDAAQFRTTLPRTRRGSG